MNLLLFWYLGWLHCLKLTALSWLLDPRVVMVTRRRVTGYSWHNVTITTTIVTLYCYTGPGHRPPATEYIAWAPGSNRHPPAFLSPGKPEKLKYIFYEFCFSYAEFWTMIKTNHHWHKRHWPAAATATHTEHSGSCQLNHRKWRLVKRS